MNLEIIILSEANQNEKHKFSMISHIRNLNMTPKKFYKTETDLQTENRLVVAKQKVGWGRDGLRI